MGWPLPTMADSDVLHVTRTKALSVVEIQKVLESRQFYQLFSTLFVSGDKRERLEALLRASSLRKHKQLLEFDFRASFFELFLGSFCVGLWNTFFDILWRAVNQVFGFFEAQAGQFANSLNNLHLLGTSL